MRSEKRAKLPRPLLFLILFEIAIPLAAFCVDGWDPYRPYVGSRNLWEFILNLMYGVHLFIAGPAIILAAVFSILLKPIIGSLYAFAGSMTYGVIMSLATICEWMLIYQCFRGEDIRWRWAISNRKGKLKDCLWMFGIGAVWLVTGYVQLMVWLLTGT